MRAIGGNVSGHLPEPSVRAITLGQVLCII